jgi:hypothetical protein
MSAKRFIRGALVYLPAGVKLYQHGGDNDYVVTRYKVTTKPAHVLFVEEHSDEDCSVLFEGESWHVPFNDVYPLRGNRYEY